MKKKLLFSSFLIMSLYTSAQLSENDKSTKKSELIYKFLSTSNNSSKLDLISIINNNPDYKFSNNKFYWGDTKNDLPHGYGLIYKKDTSIFIGEFSNGKRNGYGIGMNEYEIYIGEYFNDFHSGYGTTYEFNNKLNYQERLNYLISNQITKIIQKENIETEKYGINSKIVDEGSPQILKGVRKSYFKDTMTNKIDYVITDIGNIINNKLTGDGINKVESIENDSTGYIEMYISNFKKQNKDTTELTNMVKYSIEKNLATIREGEFLNGILTNGKMSIYSNDGDLITLEGRSINKEFWNGKFITNKIDYSGNFKNLQIHGKGVMKIKFNSDLLTSGSYFEGTFLEGSPKEGLLFNSETNDYMKGSFVNGLLNGKVKITNNGKESEAIFNKGVRQNNSITNKDNESEVIKLYQLITSNKF